MNRTGRGHFQKGKSGNPGGRPKAAQSARDAARQHMDLAITTLVRACRKGSVTAAVALLDRGFGRPIQPVDVRHLITKRLETLSADELAAIEEHLEATGTDETAH